MGCRCSARCINSQPGAAFFRPACVQLTVHVAMPRNMSYAALAAAEQNALAACAENIKAFFR